jgi:hypothetical protein
MTRKKKKRNFFFTNVAKEGMDGFSKLELLSGMYGYNRDNNPTWET